MLGKDRKGKEIVGDLDPQRKRRKLEQEIISKRRELSDMLVTCSDCAGEFTFTVIEQEFFQDKGWPIPRKRCKACATAKRTGRATRNQPEGMRRKRAAKAARAEERAVARAAARVRSGKSGKSGVEGEGKGFGKPIERLKAEGACFICGQKGHLANDCAQRQEGDWFKCHLCGKNGHKRSECPENYHKKVEGASKTQVKADSAAKKPTKQSGKRKSEA